MITCKEDLYGTHVFYRDTEAMKEYIRLIRALGVGDVSDNQPSERECVVEVHKCDWTSSGYDASMTDIAGIDDGSKRLTLSDFKPARTEYVQVTESIFDLRDEFERGELYKPMNNDTYEKITCESKLGELYGYRLIYRKVEKVVDWQDEVHKWHHTRKIGIYTPLELSVNSLIESHPDKFLEMCRVALRVNGEIE